MPRSLRASALAAIMLALAACTDKAKAPTAPADGVAPWTPRVQAVITPGTCVSLSQLYAEADLVFGGGGPDANSVKSKIDQIDKANRKNDRKKATDAAFNTVRFIFQKFRGPQPLAGTPEQVGALITHVFCYAGIDIVVTDPANASLVDPSNQTQVVTSADNEAGTSLPPNSITEPTVLEFKKLSAPQTLTRLDQYPGFYVVTASSASGSGPAAPVVVAICPDANIPAGLRGRLRLGHQKTSGFEITPPADASFLSCPTSSASASKLPGWLGKALSFVMPKTMYAAEPLFIGGVGGLATEFSPFAPIDPEVSFSGGVGGLATEFKKTGTDSTRRLGPPGPRRPTNRGAANSVSAVTGGLALSTSSSCATPEAVWGTDLAPECRPSVLIKTALGTPLRDVPVAWAVTAGGGSIAPLDPVSRACGAYASTAATTTADSTSPADTIRQGRAGICWTLGPAPGTNTASATPSAGGDAPAGTIFTPASVDFTATGVKASVSVSLACPAVVVYNGTDQSPCTASATDVDHGTPLGAVPVAYGPTSPPRNVGSYTADASFAATTLYNAATAHATFDIVPPPPTWAATGPDTVVLLNDGSSGLPSMRYKYVLPGGGVPTRTWSFSTTAPAAATFTQAYSYYGFHAFYQVTVFVHPFVIHNGIKSYLTGVDQGPVNCCTPPSGGFTISGSATFTVAPGDTYGFEIGGSNFDSNSQLAGTFVTAPSPLYVNHLYDLGGHNCWHDITIAVVDASTLRWTNGCAPAVSWLLHATANPDFYTSGPDYPYFGTPADVGFAIMRGPGGIIQVITGPSGEPYTLVP